MRLALLTDLHANRQAVTACLAHAAHAGAHRYAFTGDLVGYGADPGWVVDLVREYVADGAIAVMGNHDAAASGAMRVPMHAEAHEVAVWTRTQLSAAQRAFLTELPLTQADGELLFVHASAAEPGAWTYVTGVDEAARSLQAAGAARIVFSGHVHTPALYRGGDDGVAQVWKPPAGAPETRVGLPPSHRYLVLPGAVGQPRDGHNTACYAIYDDSDRSLAYFRIGYDVSGAARRVIAAGLPIVLAMRLVEGI